MPLSAQTTKKRTFSVESSRGEESNETDREASKPTRQFAMPDDYQTKLQLALWGAIAGGVVSFIVNLLFSVFVPRVSRWNLTCRIQVDAESPQGNVARCRVFNRGYWTMGQAMAYLSLEITREDVLQPPAGYRAFITPENFIPLDENQLCWSVRAPKNPIKVDIFAKEKQPLALCEIDGDFIMIPSEEGWTFPNDNARVFLRPREYAGMLKIVSADTNARCFNIQIHPENAQMPLVIVR